MKEFVYGSADQFRLLGRELNNGKKYKFANRQLPASCIPARACLWFGKEDSRYIICIDKGISTRINHEAFKKLIEFGEISFSSMEEMVSFWHSLKSFFPESNSENNNLLNAQRDLEVINKNRLQAIRSEDNDKTIVGFDEISKELKSKVYGQDNAIDEISRMVVINHIRRENKLLVIALLGPTATGKSETAKSLAEVMSKVYGKKYGYIEIAGNEFISSHTVHRFFGAPPGYIGYGESTLLDPIRKNPYHVIVINEIEKADRRILEGLMEAIDTGMLGMADNSKPINLNKCVMLFTSNLPIDMDKYEAASSFERSEICRDAFTKHCGRPEISGKICNFIAFSPLSDDALTDIVIKFIREELDSYRLKLAYVDEYLMADFLNYRTKYGARGVRWLVRDALGKHLLITENFSRLRGKKVLLKGSVDNIVFEEIQEE